MRVLACVLAVLVLTCSSSVSAAPHVVGRAAPYAQGALRSTDAHFACLRPWKSERRGALTALERRRELLGNAPAALRVGVDGSRAELAAARRLGR